MLTFSRILVSWTLYHSVAEGNLPKSLLIVLYGLLTDALDGFLARKLDCNNQYGIIFDPIADKILLIGLYMGIIANPELSAITCLGLNAQHLFIGLIVKELLLVIVGAVLLFYFKYPITFFQSVFIGKVGFVVLNISSLIFLTQSYTHICMLLNILAAVITLCFYLKRILHGLTQ